MVNICIYIYTLDIQTPAERGPDDGFRAGLADHLRPSLSRPWPDRPEDAEFSSKGHQTVFQTVCSHHHKHHSIAILLFEHSKSLHGHGSHTNTSNTSTSTFICQYRPPKHTQNRYDWMFTDTNLTPQNMHALGK